jgi:hypothetical protein
MKETKKEREKERKKKKIVVSQAHETINTYQSSDTLITFLTETFQN